MNRLRGMHVILTNTIRPLALIAWRGSMAPFPGTVSNFAPVRRTSTFLLTARFVVASDGVPRRIMAGEGIMPNSTLAFRHGPRQPSRNRNRSRWAADTMAAVIARAGLWFPALRFAGRTP
jgi:hypothetical protein